MEKETSKPGMSNIIFNIPNPEGASEIIRLSKEGFYYKGEKIDDIHEVYRRFNEWLTDATPNTHNV